MADGSVTIEVELTKEQLEKGLKSLNKDLEKIKKPTKSITDNLTKGLDSVGKAATKTGKALSIGVTTPLIALGTAGVKYNAQMEDFEANLTTLLGNADKAKTMLNDLKEMANTTPFETSDLLEATQMMLGFGLQADKTKGYLQTLGDISMGNSEKLMSLTRAFSQMGAAGKATMEDINQMIDAGFNPLQIMAETTGKSMAQLRDEVSAGKITFEDVAGAMQIATSEGGRYYQAMEKASQTMNGKLSTAMDALKTALGELTQSLLPFVTKVVEKITEWANAFANLDEGTQEVILKLAGIVAIAGPVLTVFGQISNGVSVLITGFGKLKTAFSTGGAGLKAFSSALTFLKSSAGIVVAVITAIVAIMVVLYNTSESFRNTVNAGLEQIKNALINMWNTIQPALQQLGEAFGGLLEKLKPLGEFLVTVLAVAFTVVANVLTFLINVITEVLTFFVNLVTTVITFFTETIPNAFNDFITKVTNFVTSVIDWFKNLPENIGKFIGEILGHIANLGLKLIEFVTKDIPNFINNTVNWFKQLPSRIWEWLQNSINKVANFATEIANKGKEGAQNLFNNIVDTIQNLPSKLAEIGKNLVQGLWNGVTSAGNWLKDKISSFAGGIIDGFKSTFGIHSPSRVMNKEIGRYLALGLGEGFNDNIKSVYSKMKSAVDFETQKLSANLTSNQITKTQIEDNRQATLNSIDENKEITVNTTTKLDSKVIARETNKVNTRQKLQYGLA